jgi:membrane associated rhomboid family serine protease
MPIRLTPASKVLLIAFVVGFVLQQTGDQFLGMNIMSWLGLVPAEFMLQHRFWQLFTYVFVHFDVLQLFLNLMMVAMIGSELESIWGRWRFLRFFFFCSTFSGVSYLLLQIFVRGSDGLHHPMAGASGGIYGLLMAFGLLYGERVLLFMMVFPMKAKNFVWILAGLEFMTSVFSGRGGLSSAAHLAGMAAGFLYLWGKASWMVIKRNRQGKLLAKFMGRNPFAAATKKGRQHLKLIINNEPPKPGEFEGDRDDPKTWH